MNALIKTITSISISTTLSLGLFLMAEKAEAAPKITMQKAQEIATSHANVPLKEVNFTQVSLDDDFMNAEYEVEFFYNNVEYDYEIDADSGKVNSFSQEIHGNMQQTTMSQSNNYITKEQAKQIAFKHANIGSAKFARVEFDFDDGIAIYEVEFYANNAEYDYEINAISSEIVKFEKD